MVNSPTISISRCFHLSEGAFDACNSSIGLQVFLDPIECQVNNSHGSCVWELTRSIEAKFLDAQEIKNKNRDHLLQWGYLNGLITYRPMIQVTFQDSETDLETTHEFDPRKSDGMKQAELTFSQAKDFHSKASLTRTPQAHATNRLIEIIGQPIHHHHSIDALLPLFANNAIQDKEICGVWWAKPDAENPGMNGIVLSKSLNSWMITDATSQTLRNYWRETG